MVSTAAIGNVYFIREAPDGLVKIGWTSVSVHGRLIALQAGNGRELIILGSIPNCLPSSEKSWHLRFADELVRSEWFTPSERLLTAISEALAHPEMHAEPAWTGPRMGAAQVREWMERNGKSPKEMALACGYSVMSLHHNLRSHFGFSPGMAHAVEKVTGGEIPAAALIADAALKVEENDAFHAVLEIEEERFVKAGGTYADWLRIRDARLRDRGAA